MLDWREVSKLSYIEDHEVEEATRFIEESLGFKLPTVFWNNMIVKLHVRPEDIYEPKDKSGNPIIGESGKPIKIALPPGVRSSEKFKTAVGLVLAQGPLCYKEDKYKDEGPPCRVGDWIVLPRNDKATQVNYLGVPMMVIRCDRVYQIVKGPSEVVRHRMLG